MTSTIADVLAGHAVRDPDAPAIVCAGLHALSFGDLDRHVRQIGAQLRGAGIGCGLARWHRPSAWTGSGVAECRHLGQRDVLPINPNLPSADLREELKRVRLDALVVPDDTAIPDWVDAAENGFAVFKATKAVSSFEEIALAPVRPIRLRRRPGK